MGEWTTARVQDRLESAADVFAQLPAVKPTGYFNAWPEYFLGFADQVGQEPEMRRPRPGPRQITEAEAAMLWLRWLERDDARIVWLRAKPHALEAHLLGVGHQPRHGEPALAVWDRRNRVAVERAAGAAEEVHGVRGEADGVNRTSAAERLNGRCSDLPAYRGMCSFSAAAPRAFGSTGGGPGIRCNAYARRR
ncbi:DUF6362 family protein [Rhodosalinus halophilus]|uniref:DUF6362 family protein n=1 Tax=Rhodosalinus halophilus TaxID=2259333 RepID=UPI001F1FE469|nr:DUF6362 family protein [Rhodosalinus halophilus]